MSVFESLTPEQRALRARIASHASWKQTTNRKARTKPGFQGLRARIAAEVDPQGLMSEADRAKAVENAVSEHFSRLALKAAAAKRNRKTKP